MSTIYTVFGVVKQLQLQEKGYQRLVIAVNSPYKTEWLKFNIWRNDEVLKACGEKFKVEDTVRLVYSREMYPKLIELHETAIEFCTNCYRSYEERGAECGCRSLPEEERKERLCSKMVLKASSVHNYRYSKGFRLKLQAEDGTTYTTVIFPVNSTLYTRVQDFHVGKVYNIVAWKKNKLLDIVDMNE